MEIKVNHVGTQNIIDEETNQALCQVTLAAVLTEKEYAEFRAAVKSHEVTIRL